jgi:putative membrane protein
VLAAPYAIVWALLAVDPVDRSDWILENALTALAIALLAFTWRSFPLRKLS